MNVRVVCERAMPQCTWNLTDRLRPAVAIATFSPMLESLLNRYTRGFQRYMPTPLSIAVLLTLVAGALAMRGATPLEVMGAWVNGMWSAGLIRFGFQAMFMLVLGHVLALAPPVRRGLDKAVVWVVSNPRWAAAKTALLAMALGWLNWGLGLVGGAILVRGVMDMMRQQGRQGEVNFGVIGAAGYASMLVWHGGLSGSAPLKVAESGHLQELVGGADWAAALPEAIGLRETVFSSWSLALTVAVALAAIGVFAWLGRTVKAATDDAAPAEHAPIAAASTARTPADQLDQRRGLSLLAGALCFAGTIWWAQQGPPVSQLRFITPDWINLLLLGLALMAHPSMRAFLNALDEAISGASGILVQFPIYFGIMGMVTGTELGTWLADGLVGATSRAWLPVALFTSSGVLNVFVPSGGGQWAVQGPLVLESCQALGLDLPRGIMAMAYGDQLTNMLQPFWALPLLGITGLKARDILPYTLLLMVVAGAVMMAGMLMWGAG